MTQPFTESKPTMTCRICSGTGKVRIGYYQFPQYHSKTWTSLVNGNEPCRNCSGTGKIIL